MFVRHQTDITVLNLVISTEAECGQIHDLQKIKMTQNEDLLEQKYFARSMPLLTPNHSFKTCGGPEVLTSTIIFRKCGVKTSLRRHECHILKTHLEFPYQIG